MKKVSGKNIIAMLRKINLTTSDALSIIATTLGINKHDIGFAGLKDKNAVTEQYVTIPKDKFKPIKTENIMLRKISETDNKLSPGNLVENEFIITLHNCKPIEIKKRIQKINGAIPNYFGEQRFGSKKDNHMIGRQILRGKAVHFDKQKKKFLVHAYQSYLFNSMLSRVMHKNLPFKNAPLIGFGTKLGNDEISKIYKQILEKEKIMPEDFELGNMKCMGSQRALFVKPKDISCRIIDKSTVQLHFILPKGSYATVLLRQLKGL